MDRSGSICNDDYVFDCHNWQNMKTFLKDLIRELTIGTGDIKTALIVFDTIAEVKWDFNRYTYAYDKFYISCELIQNDFLFNMQFPAKIYIHVKSYQFQIPKQVLYT